MAERYCSQGHRGCLYIGDAPHESSSVESPPRVQVTVYVTCSPLYGREPAEAGSRTTDKPDG